MILSLPTLRTLPPPTVAADVAVQAIGLRLAVGGREVLGGIDLVIERGSITAITGGNGAGKTTLLRALARLVPLAGGELSILGCRFAGRSLRTPTRVRRRIGIIGHGLMLYQDLSVAENLGFFGRLYGIQELDTRISHTIEALGLASRQHELVRTLSRGMAQRVAIARALVSGPDLLLADEPFTGLDADGASRLERLLQELRDRGGTVILAEHDAGRCARLCDCSIVLDQGFAVTKRIGPHRMSDGEGASFEGHEP